MKKYYTVLSVLLLLTACSKKVDFETMSAEEIYNYAMDEMEKTRYAKAETAFETLETDHPYSQWAVRSKLMGAYAYYKDEKYDDAIMAVDRFIKYHPGNKDVPYALYLKGMCYYDQISSADRDQGNTQKAAETFALLMAMYPDSEYAKDAAGKMNLTEDYKAGQEMIIGRYYLHEGNYLSALNRFNVVLENYQKTIQIEEALYRQVEIYAIFGLNNYANGYYKILKKNYPDGKWTAKAEKVMRKIGVDVKPSKKEIKAEVEEVVEPNKEDIKVEVEEVVEPAKEESKGWFSGWFGGKDDEPTEEIKAEVEEVIEPNKEESKVEVEEVVEPAKEESKGWFSGWFGGKDDEPTEEIKAEVEEVVEPAKEESKGWFSGWFGGKDDEPKEEIKAEVEEVIEPNKEESKGWFSGWFGGSEISEDMAQSKKAASDTINETLDGAENTVAETSETVEENVEETKEKSSWYRGLFSGGTLMKEDAAE